MKSGELQALALRVKTTVDGLFEAVLDSEKFTAGLDCEHCRWRICEYCGHLESCPKSHRHPQETSVGG